MYWHIGFKPADYSVLAEWWSRHSYGRHLYIGQGVYRIGGKGWEDPHELLNQVNLNRDYEGISGSMYFSSKMFLQNKDSINAMMRHLYRYPSLVPVMDWLPIDKPSAPLIKRIAGTPQQGVSLEWEDHESASPAYYVVYRFNDDEPVNLEDATRIRAIVPRTVYERQSWTDTEVAKRSTYRYTITAVSRLHHESEGSAEMIVRTRGRGKAVAVISNPVISNQ